MCECHDLILLRSRAGAVRRRDFFLSVCRRHAVSLSLSFFFFFASNCLSILYCMYINYSYRYGCCLCLVCVSLSCISFCRCVVLCEWERADSDDWFSAFRSTPFSLVWRSRPRGVERGHSRRLTLSFRWDHLFLRSRVLHSCAVGGGWGWVVELSFSSE